MPAWKIMVLNFAAAQRAARSARRCRAAGPLALLPENIFCIELLGAEAIINLGHCCRFFAAVTSGEYDEARRAFPLLNLRCARRIYLSEVSATYIYLSEVSATEAVWRLMFPSLQQPHKRRNCSDGTPGGGETFALPTAHSHPTLPGGGRRGRRSATPRLMFWGRGGPNPLGP